MAAAIPVIGFVGQALFGGGAQQPQLPALEAPKSTAVDDEIASQTERNQAIRRSSASQSGSLTNIQDNPIEEDSLLRIIAGGK